ncbi:MAG: class I SAM-dependent methyltransferase [Verrucomicrobia bacterium]|nr:class I SAM-dependent methyltransferase [Verrucomicrobiota bacterium]MDA1085968.1 class I SAM-dependent methyltransferase [Verrucomicrobiota bacterium]
MPGPTHNRNLEATRRVLEHLGGLLNTRISVRLWDGSVVPLGSDVDPRFFLSINRAGILGAILKKPTLENVLLQYVSGDIDFHGGDIYTFLEVLREGLTREDKKKLKSFNKLVLLRNALPLLFSSSKEVKASRGITYEGPGTFESDRDNEQFVQFHYDVSNDFYQQFLDPGMVCTPAGTSRLRTGRWSRRRRTSWT